MSGTATDAAAVVDAVAIARDWRGTQEVIVATVPATGPSSGHPYSVADRPVARAFPRRETFPTFAGAGGPFLVGRHWPCYHRPGD